MAESSTPKRKLGQYELGELLGRGGMAAVYRAYQPSIDRYVAIKVITANLAGNEQFVSRFEREIRIITRLEHPNIVPVYDFGREGDGTLYLVMRLVEGGSLDQKIGHDKKPLSIRETFRMLGPIASALDYAHTKGGVIHRDLKPSNVLLDEQRNPYLTDFGIAKMNEPGSDQQWTQLTHTGSPIGTPEYMSPEQWRSEPLDRRSDVYSLGIMLYKMLTGTTPFTGSNFYQLMLLHIDAPFPSVRAVRPELPAAIDRVLRTATAKAVGDRYGSAGQLVEAFEMALQGELRTGTTPAVRPSRERVRPPTPPPNKGNETVPVTPSGVPQTTQVSVPPRTWIRRRSPYLGALAILLIVGAVALAASGGGQLFGAAMPTLTSTPLPLFTAPPVVALLTTGTQTTHTPSTTPIVVASSTATYTPQPTHMLTTVAPNLTRTPTPTLTLTHTSTPVPPATHTATLPPSAVPSPTHPPTRTPSATFTVTATPVPTATHTVTPLPTATHTSSPTLTPTLRPSSTFTRTPTATYTWTLTPSPTPTRTFTATFTLTSLPTSTPSVIPSATPSLTITPCPTPTASLTPTPSSVVSNTPTPTPSVPVELAPTATINQDKVNSQQLAYGDTVMGKIDDQHILSPAWKFHGNFGDRLQITVRRLNPGDSLIPVIHVVNDKDGRPVDWSDNNPDKNVLTTVPLPGDGTYDIIISRLNLQNGKTSGQYTLNLTLLQAGVPPTLTPTPTSVLSATPAASPTPTLTPTPTTVRSLYYGQTVAGILPTGSAVDQWTFTGAANDIITVQTVDALNSGHVFAITLIGPGIPDPGQTAQGGLSATLAQPGTYSIRVNGQTGPYTLTLKVTGAAVPAAKPNQINYNVNTGLRPLNSNTPEANWTFFGHKGDVITLTVTPDNTLDPVVELYDPSGMKIAANDDSYVSFNLSDPHADSAAAIRHFALPADGLYRIHITRYQGKLLNGSINGGQYTLSLALDPAAVPPLFSYPPSALLINPQESRLDYGDTRDGTLGPGSEQVYAFLARMGDTVQARILAKSGDLEPTLQLTDDLGSVLYSSNQQDHGHTFDQLQPTLITRTGKYTLTVGTKGYRPNSGDYRLDLALTGIAGTLTPDNPQKNLLSPQFPQRAFTFQGVAGQYIRLIAEPGLNSQLDPFLILLAPNGWLIAFASSSADRKATLDGLQLGESGQYTAIVTRPGGDAGVNVAAGVGEFNLTMSLLPGAPSTSWANPTGITLSSAHPVAGLAAECPDSSADSWQFTARQDDLITLSVNRLYGEGSAALAGVIGPDGQRVAPLTASDSGPQATYHLPATGTYTVRVNGQHCQYALLGQWLSNQPPLPPAIDYTRHDDNKITGTLPAGGKAAFTFQGKTNDSVHLLVYWLGNSDRSVVVTWTTPDGTTKPLDWKASLTTVDYITTLNAAGPYVITVTNRSKTDVTLNVDLRAIQPDATATPLTMALSSGQVLLSTPNATGGAIYQFLAHKGQHIHLALEVPVGQSPQLIVQQPNGQPLTAKPQLGNGYNTLDADLTQDGQYSVIVTGVVNIQLRMTFALTDQNAPPTPTVQLTPDVSGQPTALASIPGEPGAFSANGLLKLDGQLLYTFDGVAGQTALVSLFISPPTAILPVPGPTPTPGAPASVYAALTLFDPDNQYVGESGTADVANRAQPILHVLLTKTGKYTVELRARGTPGKTVNPTDVGSPFYLTVVSGAANATATPVALNTLSFEKEQQATLTAGGNNSWQYVPASAQASTLFVVRPWHNTTLRAALDIYTLDGLWEGNATATNPGDDVRLLIPLSSAQPYRIIVRALDNTASDYMIYAAGNPAGIVVFGTKRVIVITYAGPDPNKYPVRHNLFGENYEGFAQSADGQWLELRDPVSHQLAWARRDKIAITYGQNNVAGLPVDQPTKP
ncbi:MAG: serine/threonine protein kinase [Aggregatilineales bacterium]